jgi:hypothetical protein
MLSYLELTTYNLGLTTFPCHDRSVFCSRNPSQLDSRQCYNPPMVRPERRVVHAGESPVRVSAGAPGSRLQSGGEIRSSRAECQRNPRWHFMRRWPSPKAAKKLRERIREITSKRQSGKEVKQIIAELTPVLRGSGNYFRSGNADREFNQMDSFVTRSLRRRQYRRGGQRPTKRPPFTGQQLYGMGLHRLQGTVRYPAQATPRRSSLSRVPENGTHGLKGGPMAQARFLSGTSS